MVADGIGYSEGSGTLISTDDAGVAGHVQIIKQAISADGSADLIPADATYGLDVDVTRIIPGVTATALGKAEDAAHTSGDTGVAVLAVRTDTAAASSGTDGDYEVLHTDATGKLWTAAVLTDGTSDLNFDPPNELTASPSIGTGACAQYDSLHTAIMTFAGAASANGGTGRILGARLVCKHDTFAGTIVLHLFRKSVTGTTAQDALAVSDADKLECFGALTFDFSTAAPMGGGRVQTANRAVLPLDYKCDAGVDDIFGILQLTSADTPTFAAADLVPFLSFIAD